MKHADVIVVFLNEWGAIEQRFDLRALAMPDELAGVFAEAFRAACAASAPASRKTCWKALRAFGRFLAEDGAVGSLCDVNDLVIPRSIAWLESRGTSSGEPLSASTRYRRFVHIKALLIWMARTKRLAAIVFPHNPFPGRRMRTRPPRHLSAAQLKAILRASYVEIDAAWARFEQGQAILAEPPSSEFAALLHDLHRSDGGVMPRLRQAGQDLSRRIVRCDRSLVIAQYLHLTVETLAPFFVAIAIQTAANSDALRLINRDCIAPHPVDEQRAMIDWAKPRARRVQRRSFDRRRPNAAPNLIDKVLKLTAPLVAHAPPSDRAKLFLVRGKAPNGVRVIAEQTLWHAIQAFIARANERIADWNADNASQPRLLLPDFSIHLFRGSVATQHHHESGGDIRTAQAVLNHASAATTELYIRGPETQRLQEETISRLQRLMVAWIAGDQPQSDSQPLVQAPPLATKADTFSHACINPLAGVARSAAPGRMCPHFAGCLTCPGLVIPVDAKHLARILQAKLKLEAARERMDAHRWELLYAPSHRILTQDILPDFPTHLHATAHDLVASLPILPDLE